jgi:uncharacterized protein
MTLKIRDLLVPDIAAVHLLNEEGTPGVHTSTPAELTAITQMCSIALIVEIDGAPIGFCQVLPPRVPYKSVNYRWFSERYDDFAYLDRVAIGGAHRGKGLGSALYAEVERRTVAEWFLLEVNLRPRNDGSLRFHARHGFEEVGQLETDYGARVSLMAKRLR